MDGAILGGTLSKIPVTAWVSGTVEAMERSATADVRNWNRFWLDTYVALGGRSKKSGSKGCPRAAAYGLWSLGRLRFGKRAFENLPIIEVERRHGKNAAYAIIAIDALVEGKTLDLRELWEVVQGRYVLATGHEPAASEQGEVRLVAILFSDGQIITQSAKPA